MSTSQSILADTRDSNAAISNGFRNYCNAQRVDTKTTVLKLFRESYRDYHVTEVEEKNASLFEFAAHDKAQLIFDAEDATFGATRAWRAVGDGIKKKMHPGTLKDEFRFARYVHNPLSPID
jgi:transitional endoplasmic reticulum ATPase